MTLWLLLAHFVGDFLFQPRWMADNKSKSWIVLALHGVFYCTPFLFWNPVGWVGLQAVLHIGVDAVTSRITYRLYQAGEIRWFFAVIGADQLIHQTCLLGIKP